jgi:hypothetical protein
MVYRCQSVGPRTRLRDGRREDHGRVGRDHAAGAVGHAWARECLSCRRGPPGESTGADGRRTLRVRTPRARGSPPETWRPVLGRLRSIPPSGAAHLASAPAVGRTPSLVAIGVRRPGRINRADRGGGGSGTETGPSRPPPRASSAPRAEGIDRCRAEAHIDHRMPLGIGPQPPGGVQLAGTLAELLGPAAVDGRRRLCRAP